MISRLLGAPRPLCATVLPITSSSRILVTLAERPYPFPSRTRKSSSPAPKILRGQPFGKIGRRQDLVLSGEFAARAAADRLCCRDDRGRCGHSARRTDARPGHPRRGGGIGAGRLACPPRLPIPDVRGRRLAARHAFARPPLCRVQPACAARAGEAGTALPHLEPPDV